MPAFFTFIYVCLYAHAHVCTAIACALCMYMMHMLDRTLLKGPLPAAVCLPCLSLLLPQSSQHTELPWTVSQGFKGCRCICQVG